MCDRVPPPFLGPRSYLNFPDAQVSVKCLFMVPKQLPGFAITKYKVVSSSSGLLFQ